MKQIKLFFLEDESPTLSKTFDDLEYRLKGYNKELDVAVVTDTEITRNTSRLCNTSVKSYVVGFTPAVESAAGTQFAWQTTYVIL